MAMQPTDTIELTLQAQQWNTVLAILAKAPVPYEIVGPLLHEIQRQCAERDQPLPMRVTGTAAAE
jgi:hypothetical protein